MTDIEFLSAVHQNPINAAVLARLPALQTRQTHLVAGALFQSVWNLRANRPVGEGIRDHDVFYWDDDTSEAAEDVVIQRATALFGDLGARIEVRNQARVHLWFNAKHGTARPALQSVHDSIEQFLVTCTCVGIDQHGSIHAPYGLHDLARGTLAFNPRNQTPGLYPSRVLDYQRRWPWLVVEPLHDRHPRTMHRS